MVCCIWGSQRGIMVADKSIVKVFIIDGQPVFRDGLRGVLERQEQFAVIGEGDNSRLALKNIKSSKPDVVIVDPQALGKRGFHNIASFKAACPDSNILISAELTSLVDVQFALSEGASGYILKNSTSEEFVNAIKVVANEGSYLPAALMSDLVEAVKKTKATGNMFGLTLRELDILREIATGSSNKEMANKLNISVRTVETHRQNIRQKTGAYAATELVRIADRLGLVKQPLHGQSA